MAAPPQPPSFSAFRFQNIGKEPELLKRISDYRQPFSASPSPAPVPARPEGMPQNIMARLSRPSLFESLGGHEIATSIENNGENMDLEPPRSSIPSSPSSFTPSASVSQLPSNLQPPISTSIPQMPTTLRSHSEAVVRPSDTPSVPSLPVVKRDPAQVPLLLSSTPTPYSMQLQYPSSEPSISQQDPDPDASLTMSPRPNSGISVARDLTELRAMHSRLRTTISSIVTSSSAASSSVAQAVTLSKASLAHSETSLVVARRVQSLAQTALTAAQESLDAAHEGLLAAEQAESQAREAFAIVKSVQNAEDEPLSMLNSIRYDIDALDSWLSHQETATQRSDANNLSVNAPETRRPPQEPGFLHRISPSAEGIFSQQQLSLFSGTQLSEPAAAPPTPVATPKLSSSRRPSASSNTPATDVVMFEGSVKLPSAQVVQQATADLVKARAEVTTLENRLIEAKRIKQEEELDAERLRQAEEAEAAARLEEKRKAEREEAERREREAREEEEARLRKEKEEAERRAREARQAEEAKLKKERAEVERRDREAKEAAEAQLRRQKEETERREREAMEAEEASMRKADAERREREVKKAAEAAEALLKEKEDAERRARDIQAKIEEMQRQAEAKKAEVDRLAREKAADEARAREQQARLKAEEEKKRIDQNAKREIIAAAKEAELLKKRDAALAKHSQKNSTTALSTPLSQSSQAHTSPSRVGNVVAQQTLIPAVSLEQIPPSHMLNPMKPLSGGVARQSGASPSTYQPSQFAAPSNNAPSRNDNAQSVPSVRPPSSSDGQKGLAVLPKKPLSKSAQTSSILQTVFHRQRQADTTTQPVAQPTLSDTDIRPRLPSLPAIEHISNADSASATSTTPPQSPNISVFRQTKDRGNLPVLNTSTISPQAHIANTKEVRRAHGIDWHQQLEIYAARPEYDSDTPLSARYIAQNSGPLNLSTISSSRSPKCESPSPSLPALDPPMPRSTQPLPRKAQLLSSIQGDQNASSLEQAPSPGIMLFQRPPSPVLGTQPAAMLSPPPVLEANFSVADAITSAARQNEYHPSPSPPLVHLNRPLSPLLSNSEDISTTPTDTAASDYARPHLLSVPCSDSVGDEIATRPSHDELGARARWPSSSTTREHSRAEPVRYSHNDDDDRRGRALVPVPRASANNVYVRARTPPAIARRSYDIDRYIPLAGNKRKHPNDGEPPSRSARPMKDCWPPREPRDDHYSPPPAPPRHDHYSPPPASPHYFSPRLAAPAPDYPPIPPVSDYPLPRVVHRREEPVRSGADLTQKRPRIEHVLAPIHFTGSRSPPAIYAVPSLPAMTLQSRIDPVEDRSWVPGASFRATPRTPANLDKHNVSPSETILGSRFSDAPTRPPVNGSNNFKTKRGTFSNSRGRRGNPNFKASLLDRMSCKSKTCFNHGVVAHA